MLYNWTLYITKHMNEQRLCIWYEKRTTHQFWFQFQFELGSNVWCVLDTIPLTHPIPDSQIPTFNRILPSNYPGFSWLVHLIQLVIDYLLIIRGMFLPLATVHQELLNILYSLSLSRVLPVPPWLLKLFRRHGIRIN